MTANRYSLLVKIAEGAVRLRALLPTTKIESAALEEPLHPFDTRNFYPDLPKKVRRLFDDGYYPEATLEACKFLDSFVGKHAPNTKSGEARMMQAFKEEAPLIQLNGLASDSEIDEQRGYKFLFAGTMIAIRNPRGHEHSVEDDPGLCLDHLGLVSALLRRLNDAGFK